MYDFGFSRNVGPGSDRYYFVIGEPINNLFSFNVFC
jgi:hypothetical protein